MDVAAVREAILEGYQDLIEDRVVEFSGDLRQAMTEAKRREKENWS